MRSSVALLALAAPALADLEVFEPAATVGEYDDARAHWAPESYHVNALVEVAATCPCNKSAQVSLEGLILVVPEDACASMACAAISAACAAGQANASGVVLGGYGWGAGLSGWCSNESPPTAYVSEEVALVLLNATSGGTALNLTMSGDEAFDCSVLDNVPWVYAGMIVPWLLATVLWVGTVRRNAEAARELHHTLSFLPCIQLVHAALSVPFFLCPRDRPEMGVVSIAWGLASIVKEPLLILSLLLVSKGWCITRDSLSRADHCRVVACVCAMYLASGVAVAVPLPSRLAVLPVALLYLLLCCEVALSITANRRLLKAQICALRHYGIDPTTAPSFHKYHMYRRLTPLAASYVLMELAMHASFEFTDRYGGRWWPFVLLHQLTEICVSVGIGYTFRPTPLNTLFEPVQAQVEALADRLLPQITTVEISPQEIGEGANLAVWRYDMQLASAMAPLGPPHGAPAAAPPTLVVINPGDEVHPMAPMAPMAYPCAAGHAPLAQPGAAAQHSAPAGVGLVACGTTSYKL